MKYILSILVLALVIGCGNNAPKTLNDAQKADFLAKGDSISGIAQKLLIGKLTQAIAQQGAAAAVEYCNLNAIRLTDSVSAENHVSIQRLSDKNRNPDNSIGSPADQRAWNDIKNLMANTTQKDKHLLLQENNEIYYYKAIPLGMPLCLNCHGKKDQDIAPETFNVIAAKYPQDKAIGYEAGQLRGMWKIKMPLND